MSEKFIDILKDIRDVKYPDIVEKSEQVASSEVIVSNNIQIATEKADIATEKADIATEKANLIANDVITVTAAKDEVTATATVLTQKSNEVAATAEIIDNQINSVYLGQSAASIGFATKSDLDANLDYAENTLAIVTNDATLNNNGTYRKIGASGSGSWVQSSYDRITETNNKIAVIEHKNNYKADLVIGRNLFNKSTITADVYIDDNQNGALVADSENNVSDYIEVIPGRYIEFSAESRFGSFFDKNLEWVEGGFRNESTAGITVPFAASYIRVTVADNIIDSFMLCDTNVPANYEPYKVFVNGEQLSPVYDEILKVKAYNYENDFFDPDLQLTYESSNDVSTVDNTLIDFMTKIDFTSIESDDNKYGEFLIGNSGTLKEINLIFSNNFLLNKLKYNYGDTIRVGFYFKFPFASDSDTRRLYTGPTLSGFDTNTIISDNEWHWHEEYLSNTIINDDAWQGVYVGARDANKDAEKLYIRGITLTNLTTDIWVGNRKSNKIEESNKELLNLNSFVKFIPKEIGVIGSIPQISATNEQNNNVIEKSIKTISYPIDGDCFVFESKNSDLFRVNFYLGNIPKHDGNFSDVFLATNDFVGKYFTSIFYVKVTADADSFYTYSSVNEKGIYKTFGTVGKFIKITTIPTLIKSRADLENVFPFYQINCSPNSGVCKIEICGLSNILSDDRYCNSIVLNTRADLSIFNTKKYTSYGDSITAQGGYQKFISVLNGTSNINRGIGGTTIINNNAIAWVDADGNYLSRPPEDKPAGTEGEDYFTITSGMCTQDRINTIPIDSDLITINGGTNDFGQNIILGDINDVPNDTIENQTFYAGYKSLLNKIQTRCPNARIILLNITSINNGDNLGKNTSGQNSVEDFREAILKIGKIYGFQVVDLNDFGININNQNLYTLDGTHPNDKYHELIGMKIGKYLHSMHYDEIKSV